VGKYSGFGGTSFRFLQNRRDKEGRDKDKISNKGRDIPPVPTLKVGTNKLWSVPRRVMDDDDDDEFMCHDETNKHRNMQRNVFECIIEWHVLGF